MNIDDKTTTETAATPEPTPVSPPPAPAKNRGGNPNWVKGCKRPAKEQATEAAAATVKPIVKATVKREYFKNANEVHNMDPRYVYSWGNRNSQEEMNMYAQKQYAPADGDERIMGNPFETARPDNTPGKAKIIGNRILMRCPREIVDARKRDQAKRYMTPKQQAEYDARVMRQKSGGKSGVTVEATTETIRESLMEKEN